MDSEQLLGTRVQVLNQGYSTGSCVIYVMSRDIRVQDNHALVYAQIEAQKLRLPLIVVFCVSSKLRGRAREQFEFMLLGVEEIEIELASYNIPLHILVGDPKKEISTLLQQIRPAKVVYDFNALRGPRALQASLVQTHTDVAMDVVDTHNIVPVWIADNKKTYSAAIFRPKIHKLISSYLQEPLPLMPHSNPYTGDINSYQSVKLTIERMLKAVKPNQVPLTYLAGERAAHSALQVFIETGLEHYGLNRNIPHVYGQSGLSAYLHFGHISSLRIALELKKIVNNQELHIEKSSKLPQIEMFTNRVDGSVQVLLEEMIIRKELADNYCYYAPSYTTLAGAEMWAQSTLQKHTADPREHMYTMAKLESAQTHDEAWNAAQRQLTQTGKMHGYMRMYWAKKVLEWSVDAQSAIDTLIHLNDFYSLDGGDANGYTGIMWSVCGVHDRPWSERDIFGTIRYMNFAGLKRKFDIDAYIHRWR